MSDIFEIRDTAIDFNKIRELVKDSLKSKRPVSSHRKMKVLFQARNNIFSNPGGDTVVMVNLKNTLQKAGVEIEYSHIPQSVQEYDLVHIINFDTNVAINAASQEKPYIVTPMYEDVNRFYMKSMICASLVEEFINYGSSGALEKEITAIDSETNIIPPDFNFIASNAEVLLASGEYERHCIRRDFPNVRIVETVKLGFDRPENSEHISPDLFISQYGVRDFVLCVGRLETRKNQLMLLYALKDIDIPVVFVNSRTIQPEYEYLCRRFRRKGKTIFTGRITQEMLFSAYKAARVHALPSWYELPGLVTLEAAWFGCNIAASVQGTIKDYLGEDAFYCEPDDPVSIRKAVTGAFEKSPDLFLRNKLEGNTWEKEAETLLGIYEKVICDCKKTKGRLRLRKKIKYASDEISFIKFRERADKLLKTDPNAALEASSQLLNYRKNDVNSLFARGAAFLLLMNYKEAEGSLRRLLRLQPCFDIKGHLYLSLALLKQGKYEEAVEVLQKSLKLNPFLHKKTRALIYEYLMKAYEGIGDAGKVAEIKDKTEYVMNARNTAGVG